MCVSTEVTIAQQKHWFKPSKYHSLGNGNQKQISTATILRSRRHLVALSEHLETTAFSFHPPEQRTISSPHQTKQGKPRQRNLNSKFAIALTPTSSPSPTSPKKATQCTATLCWSLAESWLASKWNIPPATAGNAEVGTATSWHGFLGENPRKTPCPCHCAFHATVFRRAAKLAGRLSLQLCTSTCCRR